VRKKSGNRLYGCAGLVANTCDKLFF